MRNGHFCIHKRIYRYVYVLKKIKITCNVLDKILSGNEVCTEFWWEIILKVMNTKAE
jgi:hypothetical protein